MSKIVFLVLFLVLAVIGYSQQDYFVLIQSDNNQPFYARVNDQTYNSSEIGHLIIPRLKDSVYAITIGFPKDLFPQQKFTVVINEKEQAFLLKNLGDKGWALYNSQTPGPMQAHKADTVVPKTVSASGTKKDDAFSLLMAGVVNDTAILYNTYVDVAPVKDTVKTEPVKKPVVKIESPVVVVVEKQLQADTLQKRIAGTPPTEKKKEAAQIPEQGPSVRKIAELMTDSVLELLYVAISKDGKRDTVGAAIFLDKVKNAGKETAKDTATAVAKKKGKAGPPSTAQPVKDSVVRQKQTVEKKTPSATVPGNSNCKNIATDYDVDKLRVKILAVDNDDDKMLVARKFLRAKCFTTKQVKALSEVFPTDEGRYKLFDTAYPLVMDPDNFPPLADLLTGQYYINRFKAMLKQ